MNESISAWGVSRPSEKVNCLDSLVIKDESLSSVSDGSSLLFGNFLKIGVINI
jgi:hypothetical protein